MTAEPHNATVTYPGALRARWRWAGSGQGPAVFALSEAGGSLVDLGLAGRRRSGTPVPRGASAGGAARSLDRSVRVRHLRRAASPALG